MQPKLPKLPRTFWSSPRRTVSSSGTILCPANGYITDGAGSCSIRSGGIYFHGIRNNLIYRWQYSTNSSGNPVGGFSSQITNIDLSSYSAVLLVYDSYKGGTWLAGGGTAGKMTAVIPVNGTTYTIMYPWNTPHWRSVTALSNGIMFGDGIERKSGYKGMTILGGWFFDLETPFNDGSSVNNAVCRPLELYGFM